VGRGGDTRNSTVVGGLSYTQMALRVNKAGSVEIILLTVMQTMTSLEHPVRSSKKSKTKIQVAEHSKCAKIWVRFESTTSRSHEESNREVKPAEMGFVTSARMPLPFAPVEGAIMRTPVEHGFRTTTALAKSAKKLLGCCNIGPE
jgi:hypothetical protein